MSNQYNILIVDDVEALRVTLSNELSSEGYNIKSASDGVEALLLLKHHHFDLVILDIKMPKMDGFEVLKEIKQKFIATKVIMLSGFADLKNVVESRRLGADDFVSKPYDLIDLLMTIKRILNEEKLPYQMEIDRLRNLVSLLETRLKDVERTSGSGDDSKTANSLDISTLKNLIAGVSHGIKGELSQIAGWSILMRDKYIGNTNIEERCNSFIISAEYSQLLLRRLIDLSEINWTKRTTIHTADIAQKINELVKPRISPEIEFKIKIDSYTKDSMFRADKEEVLIVLMELVENAISVLQNNGGKIRVKFKTINDYVKITVEDTGPGIPSEIRKNLLSKRVNSKRGLGVGLYLAAKIVKSFDGELEFTSKKGKGTTFSLFLPLERKSKEN